MPQHRRWERGEPRPGVKPSRGMQRQRCSAVPLRSPAPAAPRHPTAAQPLPWLRPCKSGQNASAGAACRAVGAGRAPLLRAAAASWGHTTSPPPDRSPTKPAPAAVPSQDLCQEREPLRVSGVWTGGCQSPAIEGLQTPFAVGWGTSRRGSTMLPDPENCARGLPALGKPGEGGSESSACLRQVQNPHVRPSPPQAHPTSSQEAESRTGTAGMPGRQSAPQ